MREREVRDSAVLDVREAELRRGDPESAVAIFENRSHVHAPLGQRNGADDPAVAEQHRAAGDRADPETAFAGAAHRGHAHRRQTIDRAVRRDVAVLEVIDSAAEGAEPETVVPQFDDRLYD